MNIDPELEKKLLLAVKSMDFENDTDAAVQWLIRYAVEGAVNYGEYQVASELLLIAESMGECDGKRIIKDLLRIT